MAAEMWRGDGTVGYKRWQDSLLDAREKKVAKNVCLASARSVMCCFSCCMVQYPLFSGPENPDLEHMLNLDCVSNLRAGH